MNYFKEMLELQDKFNQKVHPEWREQNYDWVQAMFIEGAEASDSFKSWKWWKAGKDDLANFEVELVDIWHFLMSWNLQYKLIDENQLQSIWEEAVNATSLTDDDITPIETVQWFTYYILKTKFEVEDEIDDNDLVLTFILLFRTMIEFTTIDSDKKLYEQYITKNVLNKFRQDFGYKDGTYLKEWNGEEDNVWAYRIVSEMEEPTFDGLYQELELVYKKVS